MPKHFSTSDEEKVSFGVCQTTVSGYDLAYVAFFVVEIELVYSLVKNEQPQAKSDPERYTLACRYYSEPFLVA